MVEKILLDFITKKWKTQDVMNNTSIGVVESKKRRRVDESKDLETKNYRKKNRQK
jgi:hypothetical protein